MIRKLVLAFAVLALTAGVATAQKAAKLPPFDAANYPAELRATFDAAAA